MKVVLTAGIAAALVFAGSASAAPDLVYRSSWQGGRYFHPLGSFGNLNRAVTLGQRRRAGRLAATLVARATPRRGTLVWRYHTRRDGPGTWESGLAQAVAAQALARAGRVAAARRAFNAIPNGLLMRRPEGPWIRLYGYSNVVVLNAQLQAALSIGHYARLTNDVRAARLARDLRAAALRLLPGFDTGSWSRYSLAGPQATLEYHEYVTALLWKLSNRQGGGRWRTYAARFRAYRRTPPKLRRGDHPPVIYPLARDGYRDVAAIRFWLSKPATVTIGIGRGRWRGRYGRGWQTFRWSPRHPRAGRHDVWATAVDRAGNATARRLRSVVVRRDTTPPVVAAELAPWRLYWNGSDRESPWLTFRLELSGAGPERVIELGRGELSGSVAVAAALESGREATLVATDSSGNSTCVPLGATGSLPRLGATLAARTAA